MPTQHCPWRVGHREGTQRLGKGEMESVTLRQRILKACNALFCIALGKVSVLGERDGELTSKVG